jgi:hypothetical protein
VSREPKSDAKAKADRKPKVDIAQTDELGLTGSGQKLSLAAWSLSAFVIVVGIVALIVTGQKIFLLFIVLGIVTPLNVLAYDSLILKPKVARLKAERAKEAEAEARAAEAEAADAQDDAGDGKETDQ